MYKIWLIVLLFAPISVIATEKNAKIPDDVTKFIEKREGCNHFRGEPAYDDDRRDFLLEQISALCTGTDAELSALKSKYKTVLNLLSEYEEDIEPNK